MAVLTHFVRAGQSRDAHASFDRERLRIATGVAHVAAKSLECRAALVIGLELREPAITHARDPFERLVGRAAHPHRNGTLHGHRIEPRAIDPVPPAGEIDDRLGPQLSHDGDLLFDAPVLVAEVRVERLVFDGVPAQAHAQARSGRSRAHRPQPPALRQGRSAAAAGR
jgi:hypothetical protein